MRCIKLYQELKEERKNNNWFFCNDWLCPFNNDGTCVATEVDCFYDDDFHRDLNILYELSSSLDEDELNPAFEAWREIMIEKYK